LAWTKDDAIRADRAAEHTGSAVDELPDATEGDEDRHAELARRDWQAEIGRPRLVRRLDLL
jgi:hypothetical protein